MWIIISLAIGMIISMVMEVLQLPRWGWIYWCTLISTCCLWGALANRRQLMTQLRYKVRRWQR